MGEGCCKLRSAANAGRRHLGVLCSPNSQSTQNAITPNAARTPASDPGVEKDVISGGLGLLWLEAGFQFPARD